MAVDAHLDVDVDADVVGEVGVTIAARIKQSAQVIVASVASALVSLKVSAVVQRVFSRVGVGTLGVVVGRNVLARRALHEAAVGKLGHNRAVLAVGLVLERDARLGARHVEHGVRRAVRASVGRGVRAFRRCRTGSESNCGKGTCQQRCCTSGGHHMQPMSSDHDVLPSRMALAW